MVNQNLEPKMFPERIKKIIIKHINTPYKFLDNTPQKKRRVSVI